MIQIKRIIQQSPWTEKSLVEFAGNTIEVKPSRITLAEIDDPETPFVTFSETQGQDDLGRMFKKWKTIEKARSEYEDLCSLYYPLEEQS